MALNQTEIDQSGRPAGYSYLFGRFRLKVAENGHLTLFSDGHAVPLSTTESTILRVLLDKHGQFVKTGYLLNCVSRSPDATENIVNGAVRGLRRALNDVDLIKSEWSKGYCFTGDVERKPDDVPNEIPAPPVPPLIEQREPPASEDIHPCDSVSPTALAMSGDHQPITREVTLDSRRNPFVVVALLVSAPVVLLPFGLGGIAMALCISRLDSRLLGNSGLLPIVPIVLYLYVVIQPFYPLINRTFPNSQALPQHLNIWIMQLAFMLKSIMYIHVTELFRTKRLLFYMIHARRVYESVETEWSAFNPQTNNLLLQSTKGGRTNV